MPKERRENSTRASLPCSSNPARSVPNDPLEDEVNIKEWEDARCAVCMEHPHNAILLVCSSHEKGCRPFMCDTSHRHSNCFDQFRNSFAEVPSVLQRPEDLTNPTLTSNSSTTIPGQSDLECERSPSRSISVLTAPSEHDTKSKLACPYCRGVISNWKVVNNARRFMNAKSRSCACETCDFNGTYTDLRKHARLMHPFVQPTEADAERVRDWRRSERESDLGDLFSMLQSSLGGDETTEESTLSIDEGSWLTVYLLVRLIRPVTENNSARSITSGARGQETVRRRSSRRLWGEEYDGDSESRNDGGYEDSERIRVSTLRRRTRSDYRVGGGDDEDSERSRVSTVRRRTRSDYRDFGDDEDSERSRVSTVRRRTRSDYRDGGGDDENSERIRVSTVRRRTRSDYRDGGDDEDSERSRVSTVRRRTRSDYRDGGGDDENSERIRVSTVRRRTRSDYRDGGGDDEGSASRAGHMRRQLRRRLNPEEDSNEAFGSRASFPGQQ